ncbi:MAG: AEC family transporter [Deltaproteobacteria bacterium]|nr:AEC family transporter [Candidatus Anaeroferrophillus wilburensis]MBN2888989.1 AEC family transporter [Deltaproteobacteria bacterium]
MVFVNILLPIFLIIAFGALFEKSKRPDFKSISDLTLYFFTPCLIFSGLIKGHEQIAVFLPRAIVFMILLTLFFWGISVVVSRLLGYDIQKSSAFSLSTIMMNTGNYGLPLVFFAYGAEGLAYGVIILVLFTFPLGTLAVYIASRGQASVRKSVLEIFKVPLFHAIILATICRSMQLPIPSVALKAIDLVGQAAIPGLLMLLGMQLARTSIKGVLLPALGSSFLRLILSPVIAILLCALLNIEGLPRNVLILQTSTPSAIIPLLYAINYDTHPEMVAGTIFISTLLSGVTLTFVLLYLGV